VPVSADYLQYVLEQLAPLGEVRAQRMFGGVGLYCEEVFFALLSEDTLYLRVDEAGRAEFAARGMQPFRPLAGRAEVSQTYYEVPAEVLEDGGSLSSWSRRAMAATLARQSQTAPRARPRRRHRGKAQRRAK
jgi:DNA transformation protein and related proteins